MIKTRGLTVWRILSSVLLVISTCGTVIILISMTISLSGEFKFSYGLGGIVDAVCNSKPRAYLYLANGNATIVYSESQFLSTLDLGTNDLSYIQILKNYSSLLANTSKESFASAENKQCVVLVEFELLKALDKILQRRRSESFISFYYVRAPQTDLVFHVRLWVLLASLMPFPLIRMGRWTRQKLRIRNRRLSGECIVCSYNLTGNLSGRCPECGTEIPEAQKQEMAESTST